MNLTLLSSAIVLSLAVNTALADTNAAGVEITIQGDNPQDKYPEANQDSSNLLTIDPVMHYLPDAPGSNKSNAFTNNTNVDDLRDRIINGFAMPDLDSPFTATHESWYAARPDYVKRMMDRSQRYLFHIVQEVEKRGMPSEIALLPMVESAFNPQAYSTSKASGIWQFVPATGKNFGLKQNWWVDNRRDVTAATDAALTYLQKLHVMFGTWDLALAAYNAGEGTVQRAIQRNQKRGLPTDYASLELPPETKNYVPKLQAVKNIMANPERYGLSIQPIANRPYFTKVTAPEQIDAKLAAQLAEISFDEFSSLNPEYNRPVLTSTGSVHEILLPVSKAQVFSENLANYNKPLVSWQTYHAKRGERMDSIARKFGINLAELRDVNDLSAKPKIASARPLLVPNSNPSTDAAINTDDTKITQEPADEPADAKPTSLKHTVQKKDTIASIAKKYGVSNKAILAANHIKNGRVNLGQTLTIPSNKPEAKLASKDLAKNKHLASKTEQKKKIRYVVKRGDTIETIAHKFDVARDDILKWNKSIKSHLIPGEKVTLILADQA